MITLGYKVPPPEHPELPTLLNFLEKEYPIIESAQVIIWYSRSKEHYLYKGNKTTGLLTVEWNDHATIDVATKNRSQREVALTTSHEYMHCIQFISRDLYMDSSNKEELEAEAIKFAEDVLERLWNEQQIYFPSK
jgi:hypothetical protein